MAQHLPDVVSPCGPKEMAQNWHRRARMPASPTPLPNSVKDATGAVERLEILETIERLRAGPANAEKLPYVWREAVARVH